MKIISKNISPGIAILYISESSPKIYIYFNTYRTTRIKSISNMPVIFLREIYENIR